MAFPEQVVEMCFLCAMIHKLKTGGKKKASLNFSTTTCHSRAQIQQKAVKCKTQSQVIVK